MRLFRVDFKLEQEKWIDIVSWVEAKEGNDNIYIHTHTKIKEGSFIGLYI